MALGDSLGSSDCIKLPKMNSVPTTDDLKFALEHVTKKRGAAKLVELPFEHPRNHITFVVKITAGHGNKGPSWTLQRGQGAGSKVMWNRNGVDIMVIQQKIRTDSQYADSSSSEDKNSLLGLAVTPLTQETLQPAPPPAPPPAPSLSDAMASFGNFNDAAPATLDIYFGRQYPDQLNAFLQEPPTPPVPPATTSAPIITPPPRPSQENKTPQAVLGALRQMATTPETTEHEGPRKKTLEHIEKVKTREESKFLDQSILEQSQTIELPKKERLPLPPPIQFDKKLVNQVHLQLTNEHTGLMSFAAFVFFLFREFVRYQKYGTPFAVVIFEVAVIQEESFVPLPPEAVAAVANVVRRVAGPLDILTHLSAGEFGALVAATGSAEALEFASALHDALSESPLTVGEQENQLLVAVGAASIPDTCAHPEVLVAAARQAKELAKTAQQHYVLFPD